MTQLHLVVGAVGHEFGRLEGCSRSETERGWKRSSGGGLKRSVFDGKCKVVFHEHNPRRLRTGGFSVTETPHTGIALPVKNRPCENTGHGGGCCLRFLKGLNAERGWI